MQIDDHMRLLANYVSSIFQDFESFHRTENELVDDDIRLISDEDNSSFITYKLEPCIYTFKDNSEALIKILQPEYELFDNSVDNKVDDITMKTKLVVRPDNIAKIFDKKSIFSSILGFNPFWDYEHNNEYISQKSVNLSTTNKKHLKCDVINGSIVNGLTQPKLFSSFLDKPAGNKVFCEPETIHYKKRNKSALNTITIHLEEGNKEEVILIGETMPFKLQKIKI